MGASLQEEIWDSQVTRRRVHLPDSIERHERWEKGFTVMRPGSPDDPLLYVASTRIRNSALTSLIFISTGSILATGAFQRYGYPTDKFVQGLWNGIFTALLSILYIQPPIIPWRTVNLNVQIRLQKSGYATDKHAIGTSVGKTPYWPYNI